MRIITGSAKGQTIKVPDKEIRPAQDMVRQAVFSMLHGLVEDAHVLDLFAGSGSYGLEALSRGAKEAVFVDNDKKSIRAIKINLKEMGFEGRGDVVKSDAMGFVEDYKNKNPKFESRNSKQIQNNNDQNPKRFSNLDFENLGLFRISDLGFRIFGKHKTNSKENRTESERKEYNKPFNIVFLSPPYKMGAQVHLLKQLAKILSPQGVIIFDHAKETESPNNIDNLQKIRSRTYGATEISILAKTGET